MKFGRAPATSNSFKVSAMLAGMKAGNVVDVVDDHGQNGVVRTVDMAGASATRQFDFTGHVFRIFDHDEAALLFQVQINRAYFSPEDAVNRDAQSRSLAIHRAAAAHNQIGMPEKIQAVDGRKRNDRSRI